MSRVRFAVAAIGLLCSFVAFAQVPGAATTVDSSGVPQRVFREKSDVFFTIGPATPDCSFEQFANDGLYYFQVTDTSGRRMLSSDPVGERIVAVRNGVLDTHEATVHSAEEARGPCGAVRVRLGPFEAAGGRDVTYLLWLTPVDRWVDPERVSTESAEDAEAESSEETPAVCADGCFHGFFPASSLITAFRVEDERVCDLCRNLCCRVEV